jgi:hypothetical protein
VRPSLRRPLYALAGAALAVVLLLAAALLAFRLNFARAAPEAHYPAPASALEAQRQDIDYFGKVVAMDRAFSPAERAQATDRLAALYAMPEALPPPKLHVALLQVMALADNGHSRMDAMLGQGAHVLPLRVTRFAEGFHVTRAAPAAGDLLGGRVTAIDGQPIEQVLARLDTLRGGVAGYRREKDAVYLVVQDLLYGLGIASDPLASTWTVTLPDGRSATRRLRASTLDPGAGLPAGGRWLSPEPNDGIERDWAAYHPQAGQLPETWRGFDRPFRRFAAVGGCAQVVRLQAVHDVGEEKLAAFLDATAAAFRAAPPCAVILDLRGNEGGDYTRTWRFANALPGLLAPGGRIVVLTDPATFSAAISTAAFVKQAGGARVALAGEPVGDRLSFHSEGRQACLPNLKACAYFMNARHEYARACDDWRECFWLDNLFPVRVRDLDPDLPVPLRFADWNAGHDAVYEAALRLVAQPAQGTAAAGSRSR